MKILKIKLWRGANKADALGMRFYGDIDEQAKHLGSMGEMFLAPDMLPMIKYRRITIWFTFEKICPYNDVSDLLIELTARLNKAGYAIVTSSIDALADTSSLEYEGMPESRFPDSERMHGYNAAGGFSVTAEKADSQAFFSLEEIEAVQELAIIFGRQVYGQAFKHFDRSAGNERNHDHDV
jgi:hypothetical protein